jgi:hypothetical protein
LTGEKHKNRHKSKADLFEKTETTSASSRRLLASRRQHKAGPTFSSQKHHAKKKELGRVEGANSGRVGVAYRSRISVVSGK